MTLDRRRYRKLPIVAYIILALATAYAIDGVWSQASDSDKRSKATDARFQKAFVDSCERGNELRVAIQKSLEGQKDFVRQFNEPPPPTMAQRFHAIDTLIAEFKPVDCLSVEAQVEGDGQGG